MSNSRIVSSNDKESAFGGCFHNGAPRNKKQLRERKPRITMFNVDGVPCDFSFFCCRHPGVRQAQARESQAQRQPEYDRYRNNLRPGSSIGTNEKTRLRYPGNCRKTP